MSERALCVGCWLWAPYSACRTVWLSELDLVLCAECEEMPTGRVERLLDLEERLAERRAL